MINKSVQPSSNHKSYALPAVLPDEHLEVVSGWGESTRGMSYVYRPSTLEALAKVFEIAAQSGRSMAMRGGGNSYGDAFMNNENIVLDVRRMNRVLEWNPENGRIRVEPGLSLHELWQYVIEDGWWPPVVTGTSKTTIGGCAGMNVHGKNAWRKGTIGEHILEFDLMLPSGEIITCSPTENSDIFHAAIGGMGLLGCFTSLTLKMTRIYSGFLQVHTQAQADLSSMFDYFHAYVDESDYIVGWMDAFAHGRALGRGDVHRAYYLPEGDDPNPSQSLRLDNQHVPENLMGIVPKSIMWLGMRPFMNNAGTQLINTAKYYAGHVGGGKVYLQTHAAFHFLLDYVPHWKKAYGPGGLIQYQPFIPKENAQNAFADILRVSQHFDQPNYLTVFKRHRPDSFLLSHALDGFSMAMDFRVTSGNQSKLLKLTRELDEIVLAANGRFYFAKDSTVRPEVAEAYLGKEAINQFRALKARCDPHNMLQNNLWRRVFGNEPI
ncbi:MAG: FAD-binding oxidoreductase [Chloroflexi bacterium]|nr:FAD-binding oxidoreductase [Chloroflexota bacterium]